MHVYVIEICSYCTLAKMSMSHDNIHLSLQHYRRFFGLAVHKPLQSLTQNNTIYFAMNALSRPLLQFAMRRYWLRLSRYVYGVNRSFAPILRQSRWSLLYDVYWLVLMMVNSQRDRNTWTQVQDQNCSFSFDQRNKEFMRNEIKQWTNEWIVDQRTK